MHTTYETYPDENQQEIPVLGVVSLWFGAGLVGITAVASVITFQSGGISRAFPKSIKRKGLTLLIWDLPQIQKTKVSLHE